MNLRALIDNASQQLRAILKEEAATLTKSAKTTAYVDEIDFQLTKDGNPLELLRNLSLAVSYGSRTEDISLSGTGTQSAVIIGVLELCLRHRTRHGIRLFVVEEPELFLHSARPTPRCRSTAENRSRRLITSNPDNAFSQCPCRDRYVRCGSC